MADFSRTLSLADNQLLIVFVRNLGGEEFAYNTRKQQH